MIGNHKVIGGLLALAVAVVLPACHRQPSRQPQQGQAGSGTGALPDDVVQPYLAIEELLVKDSIDGLSANAAALASASRTLGQGGAPIGGAALKLQQVSNVAEARQQFGAVSEALVAYKKTNGLMLPSGVREAYCPMAKKPWLQKGSTIANPYYGTDMPTCGEFK